MQYTRYICVPPSLSPSSLPLPPLPRALSLPSIRGLASPPQMDINKREDVSYFLPSSVPGLNFSLAFFGWGRLECMGVWVMQDGGNKEVGKGKKKESEGNVKEEVLVYEKLIGK